MQWFAQAPSNIALIKYMGKHNEEENLPANPSLSYTLDHLISNVSLEVHSGKKDVWEPLVIPGAIEFKLSSASQQRFLNHLSYLKQNLNYSGSFIVRSSNNFPHSSGLASSASSFAALTKCAVLAISELTENPPPSINTQAQLSRHGSGSSCRSFFAPWALWDGDNVSKIENPFPKLLHQVIIVSHDEKKVPSTSAHLRIKTSNLYNTRQERAKNNLQSLISALESNDWINAYRICWREFQDMHQLFTTSHPPFSYMTAAGNQVLSDLQDLWQHEGDGPIVTMDAGPNIHLLYRPDQQDLARKFKSDVLIGQFDVL